MLYWKTGLGGRRDATNIVSTTELAVITHIALDHMQYLGNTIEQIAGEKAGIIKPGTRVVSAQAGGWRGRGAACGLARGKTAR